MKTKIKNFFNSRWAIFILAFCFGILFHFAINTKLMAKDLIAEKKDRDVTILSDNFISDFDKKMEEHFKQIRLEQEKLFSDLNNGPIEKFNLRNSVDIKLKEDDNYKYVEIDPHDISKDYLKVEIDKGLLRIYGEVKDVKKEDSDNHKMYSSFASTISRILTIPPGVNEKKAEILKEQNKIIVKFPKIQATT